VTPSNINHLLLVHGYSGAFDLLSIDIDSHDYWVWKAIRATPRVVVIEYNPSFGPDLSVTIPYSPEDREFRYDAKFRGGIYHGASLRALTALGTEKGYSLVGCGSDGANAFFVRTDCSGGLPIQSAAEAWSPIASRAHLGTLADQQRLIADLPIEDV